MALRATPVRHIGTLSTLLANAVLSAAHLANLSSPFSALLLGGGLFRCLTLPLTIYGDQCLSRTAAALPELQVAHRQYTDIVDHPKAVVWERRVAAQKLKNDRDRIFRSHRTNNVKMMLPHVLALLASWYMLGIPSQQLGEFFTEDAGMDIVSPLAVTAWRDAASRAWTVARSVNVASTTTTASVGGAGGASVMATISCDPTLTLAATLTLYNVFQHLGRRAGFNDRLDGYLRDAKRACLTAYGVVALAGLAATPLASATATAVFFPSYLGPIWLGMATTTFLKTLLLNGTAPGRALCRIEPYPLEHGTYGGESTAAGHEYRLAFTGVDAEEKRDVWQSQKRALDYECDVRLHKFLAKTGLFDPVEELEYEAEKLKQRRAVAHERAARRRRVAREAGTADADSTAKASETAEDDEEANRGSESAARGPSRTEGDVHETYATAMTPMQRRRAAREAKREAYRQQREAREKTRQSELAEAAEAARKKHEDRWRSTVRVFDSPIPSSTSASSLSSAGGCCGGGGGGGPATPASPFQKNEPAATDYADRFLDEYNADLSQRRVDRQTVREAAYRQRSPISPAEHLLGSTEAAAAAATARPPPQSRGGADGATPS